eukprot:3256618-Prymnesium_polylepis.1
MTNARRTLAMKHTSSLNKIDTDPCAPSEIRIGHCRRLFSIVLPSRPHKTSKSFTARRSLAGQSTPNI